MIDHNIYDKIKYLGSYFHQDWNLDGSEAQIVDKMVAGYDLQTIQDLVQGIETILAEANEEQADKIISEAGVDFIPTVEFGGYLPWLASLAARLKLKR